MTGAMALTLGILSFLGAHALRAARGHEHRLARACEEEEVCVRACAGARAWGSGVPGFRGGLGGGVGSFVVSLVSSRPPSS